MKIVIISDTHLNSALGKLNALSDQVMAADLIIHAGDYTEYSVVEALQSTGKFAGVWGNGDSAVTQSKLPEKQIISLNSYRLGVFHGHGHGKCTPERAYAAFANDDVDIIVFGHSHQPSISTKKKVLMLNPGSPTNKRTERWFSYILLELLESSIEAKVVFF